jgi:hypothetical protein
MKPDQALIIVSQMLNRLTLSHAEAFAVTAAMQTLVEVVATVTETKQEQPNQTP